MKIVNPLVIAVGLLPVFGFHPGYDKAELQVIETPDFPISDRENGLQSFVGTITDIYRVPKKDGRRSCIEVDLETSRGMVTVMLGPEWYLNIQKFGLELGDELNVTGIRVKDREKKQFAATTAKKDGHLLEFRNELGSPTWSRIRKIVR